MKKKLLTFLIIIIFLLVLIYFFIYNKSEIDNKNSIPENINSIPDNIKQLCESRANGLIYLKPYSCKDNNLGVAYSLRSEATGDAGTNYYLKNGSIFYNCGAFLDTIPEGYQEKCDKLRALECKEFVQC